MRSGAYTPNLNSFLDLRAADKGCLLHGLTIHRRKTLGTTLATSPDVLEIGWQAYDSELRAIFFWDGTQWVQQVAKNIYDSNTTVAASRMVNLDEKKFVCQYHRYCRC